MERLYHLYRLCGIALVFCCGVALGNQGDSMQLNKQDISTLDSTTLDNDSSINDVPKKRLDYANLFTKPNIEWNKIANEKSGFFIGLGALGVLLTTNDYLNNLQSIYGAKYPFGIGLHTKFGYARYSTPYIGFRVYGEYSRIFSTDSFIANIESSAQNAKTRQYIIDSYNIGINIIFDTNIGRNYNHSLGVIIDFSYLIGMDFASHWTQEVNTMQTFGVDRFLSGNKFALGLGVGYVYNSKHRLELLFRRFVDIRQSQESFVSTSSAPIIFNQVLTMSVGYVYVF